VRIIGSHQADLGLADSGAGAGQPVADQVTLLYRMHGMDLVRIAAVMLGTRAGAEDAVHNAFCAMFRNWDRLAIPATPFPTSGPPS
jgi:DNA-directed RNA polymerase specialized sigma24 family protein